MLAFRVDPYSTHVEVLQSTFYTYQGDSAVPTAPLHFYGFYAFLHYLRSIPQALRSVDFLLYMCRAQ